MVAYCIAAHRSPTQTRRLVRRLLDDDPTCRVVLHYDQRQERLDVRELVGPRVTIVPERPVYWGSFEFVDLFIEMARLAIEQLRCSYVVLLSGQDYPLRSVHDLEPELARFDVWVDAQPLVRPGVVPWPEGMRRYSYRWWRVADPGRLLRGLDRIAAKVPGVKWSSAPPPFPRITHTRQHGQLWWGIRDSTGPGVPIYVGSAWMSLSPKAVATVLSAPRRVMSFFHHVPISDEVCLQTILHNAPGLTIAPGNGRFIRWKGNESSPEILTADDLETMLQSGAHFARKFDEDVDGAVLDLLDTQAPGPGPSEQRSM